MSRCKITLAIDLKCLLINWDKTKEKLHVETRHMVGQYGLDRKFKNLLTSEFKKMGTLSTARWKTDIVAKLTQAILSCLANRNQEAARRSMEEGGVHLLPPG